MALHTQQDISRTAQRLAAYLDATRVDLRITTGAQDQASTLADRIGTRDELTSDEDRAAANRALHWSD